MSDPAMAPVLVERDGKVAVITLNRPKSRNAINYALARQFFDAMADLQDAGCIIITGADPAFCAGMDLRDAGIERLADTPPYHVALADSRIPVIAAVNGPAITGGLEIALGCDFIIASEKAIFADTHLRVGVYPGPVLVDLPRRIGIARAREMSLTGNFVDAATASRIGLANHVVKHEELLPFTLSIARAIAEQDRKMVSDMRTDWNATMGLPVAQAQAAHMLFREQAGYAEARSEGLSATRETVLARAREQQGS